MTSSTYVIATLPAGTPISANTNIFQNDVDITTELVNPGGAGVLRLYFSFDLAASPAIFSLYNNSTLVGQFNGDNAFEINTNGYYRFDVGIENGDGINLQCSEIINTVNQVRAHLVQFGA